jgi:hypothetical protein
MRAGLDAMQSHDKGKARRIGYGDRILHVAHVIHASSSMDAKSKARVIAYLSKPHSARLRETWWSIASCASSNFLG